MRIALFIFIIQLGFQTVCYADNQITLVGNNLVGLKFKEFKDSVTNRPYTTYIFYPSSDKGSKATLETMGPINSDVCDLWKSHYSIVPNIDMDATLKVLQKMFKDIDLNATLNATPIKEELPVLIFQPGATGQTQDYAFFLEQVASKGIIVISIDRPRSEGIDKLYYLPEQKKYITYKGDDSQPEKLTNEFGYDGAYESIIFKQSFEQLNDIANFSGLKINTKKIFIAGHSLGGHGAWRTSKYDLNVAGYINLDGSIDANHLEDFKKNKNFYLVNIESKSSSEVLADEKVINKIEGNVVNYTIKDGMDHGSVGNTPVYIDNSPSGKAFSIADDSKGKRLNAKDTYSELAIILDTIINH